MRVLRPGGQPPGGWSADGQSVVELALVMPVMLALLVIAVDVGRLFHTYVGLNNAAREGAAYGMTHPTCWTDGSGPNECPDPGNIAFVARQEMGGDPLVEVSVSCSPDCSASDDADGSTVTVTASRSFPFLFPIVPTMRLGASATAVIQ